MGSGRKIMNMQTDSDALLVTKLKEGNKFAFEALYEKYSAKLYNSIVLLVYDKSTAKDITQSCFLTIWEKRNNLDSEKSFTAYLYTIARNMVYKETERLLLHNKFVENKLNTEVEPFEEDAINMDVSLLEKQIELLLQNLPDISQKIFHLKREEELSNKEIATRLGLTERAVEAHFYRTMKLLKEELRKFIMIFLSLYFLNNC